jgi:hypothetical protein
MQEKAVNLTFSRHYQNTKPEVIRHDLRHYYATASRKEGDTLKEDTSTHAGQSPAGEAHPCPPDTRPQNPQIRQIADMPADLQELASLWARLPEALRAGFVATAKALGGLT